MSQTKVKKYIVLPRDNKEYKLGFAKSGNTPIPFGTPIELTEQDILQLENQKTATKTGQKTPYDLAKEKGVSIDKAVDMMSAMGDVSQDRLQWMPRYTVQPA